MFFADINQMCCNSSPFKLSWKVLGYDMLNPADLEMLGLLCYT